MRRELLNRIRIAWHVLRGHPGGYRLVVQDGFVHVHAGEHTRFVECYIPIVQCDRGFEGHQNSDQSEGIV